MGGKSYAVKFDGKHWIGKKRSNERLEIRGYHHVMRQARESLGFKGIVAIPNARPDEYRFEEFISKERGNISLKSEELTNLDDRRSVFYDSQFGIYLVKAQEIKTKIQGISVVLLAYNLPFEINLSDKDGEKTLEEAAKYNCILGINLPSSANWLDPEGRMLEIPRKNLAGEKEREFLLNRLDFVVGYSGGAAWMLTLTNAPAKRFYNDYVKEREFENPLTKERHKIGVIAVSGGHRTPDGFLETMLNGGQTIGRSYTWFSEIHKKPENFMVGLRERLRDSTTADMRCKPIIIEAVKHWWSIKFGDPIRELFPR